MKKIFKTRVLKNKISFLKRSFLGKQKREIYSSSCSKAKPTEFFLIELFKREVTQLFKNFINDTNILKIILID